MKFDEAEIVMTNDGNFYREFIKRTTPATRYNTIERHFRRLFPQEVVTNKKIRMLQIHYEKMWLQLDQNADVCSPQPTSNPHSVVTVDGGYITGYGVTMSIPKLMETIHYVNGVDVRKLSDDQLITIIRDREMEIAKLNSTGKKPARLQKRANELQAELDALVTFLDGLDTPAA